MSLTMKNSIVRFFLAFIISFFLSLIFVVFWYELLRIYKIALGEISPRNYRLLSYLIFAFVSSLWALFSSAIFIAKPSLMKKWWSVALFAWIFLFASIIFTGADGYRISSPDFLNTTAIVESVFRILPVSTYAFPHAWLMRKISARWEGRTPQKNILDDELLNEN